MIDDNLWVKQEREKVATLRTCMMGYILGEELTPFLTDHEVLELCVLKDRLAYLHNQALERSRLGKKLQKG